MNSWCDWWSCRSGSSERRIDWRDNYRPCWERRSINWRNSMTPSVSSLTDRRWTLLWTPRLKRRRCRWLVHYFRTRRSSSFPRDLLQLGFKIVYIVRLWRKPLTRASAPCSPTPEMPSYYPTNKTPVSPSRNPTSYTSHSTPIRAGINSKKIEWWMNLLLPLGASPTSSSRTNVAVTNQRRRTPCAGLRRNWERRKDGLNGCPYRRRNVSDAMRTSMLRSSVPMDPPLLGRLPARVSCVP